MSNAPHATAIRHELGAKPIREAVTRHGKALATDDTVARARQLFENDAVQVLPVLENGHYVGALDRGIVASRPSRDEAVGPLAVHMLPTVAAAVPSDEALALLDRNGATRLVVLEADHSTYVGIVCLRSDRERMCVHAEDHDDPPA